MVVSIRGLKRNILTRTVESSGWSVKRRPIRRGRQSLELSSGLV